MAKKISNESNSASHSGKWSDYYELNDDMLMSSAVHTNDELDNLLDGLTESERVQALSSTDYNPSDLFIMLDTIVRFDNSIVYRLYSFDSDNDDIWCRVYSWSDKAYEARNKARLAWCEAGKPRPKQVNY